MIPRVKICGLSRPEDIEAVNEAQADYAGFVFFEKSIRNVSFRQAKELLSLLDDRISSVAVCVSPDEETAKQILDLGFDLIQIHGKIPEILLDAGGIPLWQAVNLSDDMDMEQFLWHPSVCGCVVDGAKYGGGETFGWNEETSQLQMVKKFFSRESEEKRVDRVLAGGLNTENVSRGIQLFAPEIVDVSSGVETDGKKDRRKIEAFIRKVREK